MRPADLLSVLRARPFKPFRIVLLDGMTYEVRHPELVLVQLGSAHIGYPAPGVEGAVERIDIIGLQAVSRIEFLDQPAAATQGNDAQS